MSTDNTVEDVKTGHTKKRQVRNEVERRRKDKINGWILRIAGLLPEKIPEKQSKNKILEQAVEYIKYLTEAKEKLLLEKSCDVQADEIRKLKNRIRHLEEENALLKTSGNPSSAFPKKLWESPGKYSNKLSAEQADALLQSFEHKSSSGDSQCHSKLGRLQANARGEKSELETQHKRLSEVECDKSVSDSETNEISSISDLHDSSDASSKAEKNNHNVPTSECTKVGMCEKANSDTCHKFISTASTQNACSSPCTTAGESQGNTFSHTSAFASKFSTSVGVGGVTQALPQIPVMSTCQNFSVVQNYNQKSQQLPATNQSCFTTVSASVGKENSDHCTGNKPPSTTHLTQIPNTVNAIEHSETPLVVTTSQVHTLHNEEQPNAILQQSSAQSCTSLVNTSGTSTVLLPSNSVQASSLHSELGNSSVQQTKNDIISLPNGTVLQKDKIIKPNIMSYQIVTQPQLPVVAPKESLNIPSEIQLSSQVTENVFVVRFLSQPSGIISNHFHAINNVPNNYSIFANNAVCQPVINNGVIVDKPFIINTGNNAILSTIESMQPQQSFPSALLLPGGQIIPVVSKATLMTASQPTVPSNILVATTDLQGTHQVANSQEMTMSSLPVTNIPASSLHLPSTRIIVTSSGTSSCEQLTSVNALQRTHVSTCGKDFECTIPVTSATTQNTVNSNCGTKRPQEKQDSYTVAANSVQSLSVPNSDCSVPVNQSPNNTVNKSQPQSKKQCTTERAKKIATPAQKGNRKLLQRPLKPKVPSSNINSLSSIEKSSFVSSHVSEGSVAKTLALNHSFNNLVTTVSSVSSDLASPPLSSSTNTLNTTDAILNAKSSHDILAKATRSIFSSSSLDLPSSLCALPEPNETMSCVERNLESHVQAAACISNASDSSVENTKEKPSETVQSQISTASFSPPNLVTIPQTTKESNQQVSDKPSLGANPSSEESYSPYSNNSNCNITTLGNISDRNRKASISANTSEPQPKKVKINEFPEKSFTCDISSEVLECGNGPEKLCESSEQNFSNCTSVQAAVAVPLTKPVTCLQQNAPTNEVHTVSPLPPTTSTVNTVKTKNATSVNGSVALPLPSVEHQHMLRDSTTVSNACNSSEHGNVSGHEISNLFLSGISDGTNNVQGTSNCDISFLTLSPAEPFDSNLSSKDASETNFSSASLLDNSEATCNQVVENCHSEKFKHFSPHDMKELSSNKNGKNESLSKSESSIISLNNAVLPVTSTTARNHVPSHLSPPSVHFTSSLLKPNGSQSEDIHQEHCKEKESVSVSSAIGTSGSEFSNTLTQVSHNLSGCVTSSDGKPNNMPCTTPSISGNMYNFSSPNLVSDLTLQLSKHMSATNFPHPKSSNSLPLLSSTVPPENQRYFEYSTIQQVSKSLEKTTFPQKPPSYSTSVQRPSSNSILPSLPCSDYSTNSLITSQPFSEPTITPSGMPGPQINSSRSDVMNKQCEPENQLFSVSLTTCAVVNRPSIYSAENLIQTQSTNHKKDREDLSNTTFSNSIGSKESRQFSSVYILGNNSTLPSSEKSHDTVSQCVPLLMTPPSLGSSGFTSYVNSNPSVHVSNIAFSMHNGVQSISCAPSILNCHGGTSSSSFAKDSISSSQDTSHLSTRNQVHGVIDEQLKLPRTYPNIPGNARGMSIPTTSSSLNQSKANLSVSQTPHLSQSNSMCFQHLPHNNDASSRITPQNSHFVHERAPSLCVSSMADPTFSLFSGVQPFQPEGSRSQKNINRTSATSTFPENNSNIFLNSMVQEIGTNINQGMKPGGQEQNLLPHTSVSNQTRSNSAKMNKSKKDKQNVNSEEVLAPPPPTVFSGSRNPVMTSYFPFHDVPTSKNDSIHNPTHCFSTCQRPFVVSAATSIHKQPSINTAGIVTPNPDIATSPQHNSSCCPRSDTLSLGFQTPSFNVNTLHRVPATTAPPPPPPPPPTCTALPSQISTHNSSAAPRPVPNFNLSNIFPDINTSAEVISLSPMKFHPPSHIFPPTPQLRAQPPTLQSSSTHHTAHQNCGLYPAQPHPPVIHNSFNSIIGPTPHGFDTRSPVQMTGAVAQTVGPPHPPSFGPTHTPSFGNVLHTLNFSMQDR